MAREKFEFTSDADGFVLNGSHWPCCSAEMVVLMAHGMGEHHLRYDRLAQRLGDASIAAYAYDHRGHGAGAQILGDFGEAGWSALVDDIATALRVLRERHTGLPVLLFAHSMGSMAAQCLLPKHSDLIDGVILSGSCDFSMVAQFAAAAPEPMSLETFNAAFEPARTPFDWLSRDENEVDKYIADPFCGFSANERSAQSMMKSGLELVDPTLWAAIRDDLPVLIMSGEKDPLHGNGALLDSLVAKFHDAGLTQLQKKIYPDARHEMLNEINRDEVMEDIVSWLKAQGPPS